PPEAAGLADIVRVAQIAWSSYASSGEFVPWHGPRLTTGVLKQSDLVGFVDGLVASVNAARAASQSARLATVNDLLDQTRQAGVTQSARDRWFALRDQDLELAARADGLEQREHDERAGLAGYQL